MMWYTKTAVSEDDSSKLEWESVAKVKASRPFISIPSIWTDREKYYLHIRLVLAVSAKHLSGRAAPPIQEDLLWHCLVAKTVYDLFRLLSSVFSGRDAMDHF